MSQNYAAKIIQRAWIYYLVRRMSNMEIPESICHPGPYCGDWMCPGTCQRY